ncbi:MAG TPA: FtsH protease activity modulator HflK [Rhodospirillales bacterium]|nr:FtsH protease activity modulator HflK [Rhodospirillales bacterium]
MPWNTQGGPWQSGGGGRGPWGGGPPGGGQQPDLEEVLRRTQEKLKGIFGGGGRGGRGNRRMVLLIGLAVVALWLASGFYRVLPEEQGVVLRFGRLDRVTGPGLHYRLPSPIEEVIKPQVARVNRIEIGYRSTATGKRELPEEALMLTGDENIIDINFVVLWRISNAADFLFNIRDPAQTLKAAAESVMREIIGRTPILEATTEGRRAIEQKAQEQLQQLMNEYGAGILLSAVQLQKADPPAPVIDAFKDVQAAQADRERLQNEAEAYANDVIPRARGEAERIIQEAEAYKQEVVARATGEASRFKAVLAAYREAKDVTLQRIYLETMQEILKGRNKVIIDSAEGARDVIPYLPLPALEERARQASGQKGGGQ